GGRGSIPLFSHFSLILEKWPFLLLSAASCVITILVQHNAINPVTQVSMGLRLENAAAAYAGYLWKMIWPFDLVIFYPYKTQLPWKTLAESAIVLTGISIIVWRERRVGPWLIVGWLWFLVTLVPVIGLIQVGGQAMADRYTYLPLVGIFLAIAFSANALAAHFEFLRKWFAVSGILILCGCAALTELQLRYWRDSESLFAHTLTVEKS